MNLKRKLAFPTIILIQILSMAVLSIFALIYLNDGVDNKTIIYALSLLSTLMFIWHIWSWKNATNKLFHPYIFFITAATLFNSGQCFLQIFGLNSSGILDGHFSDGVIITTLFIVLSSLSFFHLGALLGVEQTSKPMENKLDYYLLLPSLTRTGWLFFFISVWPTVYLLIKSIHIVLSSGYLGLYNPEERVFGLSATPRVLSIFFVPAVLFLLAGSKDKPVQRNFSLVMVVSYALVQFFLGTRSAAVMPLISYAWVWDKCIRRINRLAIILLSGITLFVIFPLVREARLVPGHQRLSLDFYVQAYLSGSNPLIYILHEMGTVMNTIAYTVMLVPEKRSFDFGIGYLYSLFTIVPNVFWKIHPAKVHGSYADWLVWAVDPSWASKGGGLGFSFVAEAYINFGWFGVTFLLLIFGFLFARMISWAERYNNPARVAALATYMSFFLFFSRSETFSIIRPLVWYMIVPYVTFLVILSLNKKRIRSAKLDYPL